MDSRSHRMARRCDATASRGIGFTKRSLQVNAGVHRVTTAIPSKAPMVRATDLWGPAAALARRGNRGAAHAAASPRGLVKPAEPYRPHLADGLEDDPLRHLGLPDAPIHEDNGHLGHLEALHDGPVLELDLEGVAGALHAGEVDGEEHLAAEADEAGGHVADRDGEAVSGGEAAAPGGALAPHAPRYRATSLGAAAAEY